MTDRQLCEKSKCYSDPVHPGAHGISHCSFAAVASGPRKLKWASSLKLEIVLAHISKASDFNKMHTQGHGVEASRVYDLKAAGLLPALLQVMVSFEFQQEGD